MKFSDQVRLQGWKEIAAYLERDERTVKRWEKQRGLPVRRIPGGGRANVYCVVQELEIWLATGKGISTGAVDAPGEPLPEDQSSSGDVGLATAGAVEVAGAAGMAGVDTEETARLPERVGAEQRAWSSDGGELETAPDATEAIARTKLQRAVALMQRPGLPLAAALLMLCVVVLGGAMVHRWQGGKAEAAPPSERASGVDPAATTAARESYLEGVYFLEQRTPASLERARQTFEQSIAGDPLSAEAYAGLASTFLLLREYSTMDSGESFARAEAAALHALTLDPKLAEAHAALGFIRFFHGFEAAEAEREFQTALALDPRSALAHHWYGSMLMHETRFSEAMQQLREAQRLQPASAAILATKAYTLGLSGRRDEAMALLERLDARHQGTSSVHFMIAQLSLMAPRRVDRYLSEMQQHAALRGDADELSLEKAAEAQYRRAGEHAMWVEVLRRERQRSGVAGKPTFRQAELEAVLGDDERALHDLAVLAEQRSMPMIGVGMDPMFSGLRRKVGFREVRALMSGVLNLQPEMPETESLAVEEEDGSR